MAVSYPTHVRRRGFLTVFPTDDFLRASAWSMNMYGKALATFNEMSTRYKLGVFLSPPVDHKQRGPDGIGGAEVSLNVHTGTAEFFDQKARRQLETLPSGPNDFIGWTKPIFVDGSPLDPGRFVWKKFIFMPLDPRYDGDLVGEKVRLAVLLHELIHAVGLDGNDPNHGVDGVPPGGDKDLFATGGQVSHTTGDQLRVNDFLTWGRDRSPSLNGAYELSGRTIALIQQTWKV
jgi:hypothetical protein